MRMNHVRIKVLDDRGETKDRPRIKSLCFLEPDNVYVACPHLVPNLGVRRMQRYYSYPMPLKYKFTRKIPHHVLRATGFQTMNH